MDSVAAHLVGLAGSSSRGFGLQGPNTRKCQRMATPLLLEAPVISGELSLGRRPEIVPNSIGRSLLLVAGRNYLDVGETKIKVQLLDLLLPSDQLR